MPLFRISAVLSLCLLTVAAAGCRDDDPVACCNPPPAGAGTPEQLMANFLSVHEDRNLDGYLELLDPEFRLQLRQETVTAFGLPRAWFDHDQEAASTEMMFSGSAPTTGVGAITDIRFVTLRQIDAWQTTDNPDFPGALESQHDVDVRIFQAAADGEKLINIRGRIIFFLSTEQVKYDGLPKLDYHLIGMIDATDMSKAGTVPTEEVCWGEVKALYLPTDPSR